MVPSGTANPRRQAEEHGAEGCAVAAGGVPEARWQRGGALWQTHRKSQRVFLTSETERRVSAGPQKQSFSQAPLQLGVPPGCFWPTLGNSHKVSKQGTLFCPFLHPGGWDTYVTAESSNSHLGP